MSRSSFGNESAFGATRPRSGRLAIVSVMLLSLLGSAGARFLSDRQREAAIPSRGSNAAAASLGSMSSFSLGLLLGGLRGPLVMILWTESETQKSDKNLEGVDTQIEWIRLLQPEFDTVHIFEIWNKAYNISVQMADPGNKYDVILGALDYAHKVDQSKPDDINIIAAIGQLYFDKLGTSTEKYYYRNRVRKESLPNPAMEKSRQQQPGWRRVHLDPILDSSFNILPELLRPAPGITPRSVNAPVDQEQDDGSDLQYLPEFGPYPSGVSTFGIAYSYYKRAEVLQNVAKQHHDQLSDLVIDSRPALSLKNWGEDELETAHRQELQAFTQEILPIDVAPPENIDDMVLALDTKPLAQVAVKHSELLPLAIDADRRAAKLLQRSLDEYVRHILHSPDRATQYQSYMEEIRAEVQLASGDAEYLTALTAPAAEQRQHFEKAQAFYQECEHLSYINLLKYYVDGDIIAQVLPKGFGMLHTSEHKGVDDLTRNQARDAIMRADVLKLQSKNKYINSDRLEFDKFLHRCSLREQTLLSITGAGEPPPPLTP